MQTDLHTIRDRVIFFFLLLASEKTREQLYAVLSPEELAYELCRLWFEEIYLPSRRYIRGWKGDFSPDSAERFYQAFSDEENEILDRFHCFLELRMDMIPDEHLAQKRIPQNDLWHNIVRHADHVLKALLPHPEAYKERLAEQMRQWLSDNERNLPGHFLEPLLRR